MFGLAEPEIREIVAAAVMLFGVGMLIYITWNAARIPIPDKPIRRKPTETHIDTLRLARAWEDAGMERAKAELMVTVLNDALWSDGIDTEMLVDGWENAVGRACAEKMVAALADEVGVHAK